ncbi:MAG: signal peptidase II, partial [Deltaproteobacteria bacterium]|nr:signal peptidase II [Deltaproteobacteria bacterium]
MAGKIKKPLLSLILLFAATVVLDQGTKQLAYNGLLEDGFHDKQSELPVCGTADEERARERFVRRHRKSVEVVNGFFNLHYVENCASAFGLMGKVPESFRFPFFLIVSVLAAAFIPYLYRKTPAEQKLMLYALPFVLGGAIGNLIDRLLYRFVIDFVQWYVTVDGVPRYWPTFNVADAAIVVGIGLMVLQMLPRKRKTKA